MWLFHTVINIHTRPRDLHLTDPTSVKTLETACLYLCAKTGNRCLGTESGEADSSRLFSRSLSAKEPLRVGLVCRRQGQRGSLLLCMPKQWASHLQSNRVLCCCVLQVCCRCVALYDVLQWASHLQSMHVPNCLLFVFHKFPRLSRGNTLCIGSNHGVRCYPFVHRVLILYIDFHKSYSCCMHVSTRNVIRLWINVVSLCRYLHGR